MGFVVNNYPYLSRFILDIPANILNAIPLGNPITDGSDAVIQNRPAFPDGTIIKTNPNGMFGDSNTYIIQNNYRRILSPSISSSSYTAGILHGYNNDALIKLYLGSTVNNISTDFRAGTVPPPYQRSFLLVPDGNLVVYGNSHYYIDAGVKRLLSVNYPNILTSLGFPVNNFPQISRYFLNLPVNIINSIPIGPMLDSNIIKPLTRNYQYPDGTILKLGKDSIDPNTYIIQNNSRRVLSPTIDRNTYTVGILAAPDNSALIQMPVASIVNNISTDFQAGVAPK